MTPIALPHSHRTPCGRDHGRLRATAAGQEPTFLVFKPKVSENGIPAMQELR